MLALASPVIEIVEGGAHHLLDAAHGVAVGVAAGGDAAHHHGHRGRGAGIAHGVDAVAAGQRVGAGGAFQDVIAGAAVQRVVAGAAIEIVIAVATGNQVVVGPGIDHIVAGLAVQGVGPGPAGQPVGAVAAVGGVVAGLAGQVVVAAIADESVVAVLADDDVADIVAGQGVSVAGAVQVLDVEQRVARGVAARVGAGQQIHGHRGVGALVVGEVRPVAAVEGVVAEAAPQAVIAVIALEDIVHRRAEGPVVAREDGGEDGLLIATHDQTGQGRQRGDHACDREDRRG